MSKACDTEEQAQETVEYYTSRGEEAYYEKSGDKYNVHRVSDNKVLKISTILVQISKVY